VKKTKRRDEQPERSDSPPAVEQGRTLSTSRNGGIIRVRCGGGYRILRRRAKY
jgi:mRNA-degrading endonuclease RelE of RelBE toxin-antitoxin system